VALLSHEVWQSSFGGRADVLNTPVEVNGIRRTIVGIMPPRFDVADQHVEVWLPLVVNPANRQNRGNHFLYLIGRLADGATLASAKAELDTLLEGWPTSIARAADATRGPHTPDTQNHRLRLDPLQAQIVGSARTAVLVLQGAVIFVLLIACANLANLLLARAESRHKEFAVRMALGAGRLRLLRQFMVEGCLLSCTGALLGLGVAVFGVRALIAAYPDSLPRSADVSLDLGVLAFTLAIGLATGVVFGLAPLLHVAPTATASALKESGQRTTASANRNRLRRGLGGRRSGARGRAGHRRRPAAAHGDEPGERGCGIQPESARHLRGRAAECRLLQAGAGPDVLHAAARAAALVRRRAERRRDERPAAAPPGERERHQHRGLRPSAKRAVRQRRLLQHRHDRLRGNDGNPGAGRDARFSRPTRSAPR
jgi:hypothetical protein